MSVTSRRDLFRAGLLAALAGGGAAALRKRRRLTARGICVGRGICVRCDSLADCGLPRALSMKRAQARHKEMPHES